MKKQEESEAVREQHRQEARQREQVYRHRLEAKVFLPLSSHLVPYHITVPCQVSHAISHYVPARAGLPSPPGSQGNPTLALPSHTISHDSPTAHLSYHTIRSAPALESSNISICCALHLKQHSAQSAAKQRQWS